MTLVKIEGEEEDHFKIKIFIRTRQDIIIKIPNHSNDFPKEGEIISIEKWTNNKWWSMQWSNLINSNFTKPKEGEGEGGVLEEDVHLPE